MYGCVCMRVYIRMQFLFERVKEIRVLAMRHLLGFYIFSMLLSWIFGHFLDCHIDGNCKTRWVAKFDVMVVVK